MVDISARGCPFGALDCIRFFLPLALSLCVCEVVISAEARALKQEISQRQQQQQLRQLKLLLALFDSAAPAACVSFARKSVIIVSSTLGGPKRADGSSRSALGGAQMPSVLGVGVGVVERRTRATNKQSSWRFFGAR